MRDWKAAIAEDKRQRKEARDNVAAFLQSLASDDVQNIDSCFSALQDGNWYARGGFTAAFIGVMRVPSISDAAKSAFAAIWMSHGDHIRQETSNPKALLDALPRLLPSYDGLGEVTLFRGEGALNRRRRSYGSSWSSDVEVAESFARGAWRIHRGGSVLLRTVAPREAIIFATDEFGENEYVVDRRKLKKIDVIRRYSEISPDEYQELARSAQNEHPPEVLATT